MGFQIWKWGIGIQCNLSAMTPSIFVPLHVGMQGGHLCLWAKVDPAAPGVERRFSVYGTGHSIPERHGQYLGTGIDEERGLVWHLFMEDPS